MKRKLFYIALVLSAIILGGWAKESMRKNAENPTSRDYFSKPEKILIYKDGNIQTLTKNDKLFSELFSRMNSRVSSISEAALAFDKESMEKTKKNEILIEFLYSKKQKPIETWYKKEYTSLIFPLTGQNNDKCFLEVNTNNYGGPIGPLSSPNIVLELLK
jgi:hypothetical protein